MTQEPDTMHTDTSISRRDLLAALLAATAAPALRALPAPPSLHDEGLAPEFTGIARWFNSPPLRMADQRGRVVLVDFWTHACINCLRTLPHVNRWHDRYGPQGLVVVGVHTPEFAFERSADNLQTAMRRFGVRHPVAQDNDYATWKAWRNQYWPAHYLVDASGRVQYRQIGEGRHEQTEAVIQALLAARPRT